MKTNSLLALAALAALTFVCTTGCVLETDLDTEFDESALLEQAPDEPVLLEQIPDELAFIEEEPGVSANMEQEPGTSARISQGPCPPGYQWDGVWCVPPPAGGSCIAPACKTGCGSRREHCEALCQGDGYCIEQCWNEFATCVDSCCP